MPTLPSVAPPARGSEPPATPGAGDDTGGFAQMLRGAQHPSKTPHEPHAKATKAAGSAQPTPSADADDDAIDGADPAASGKTTDGADPLAATDEGIDGDPVHARAKQGDNDAGVALPSATGDTIALPRPVIDAGPCSNATGDDAERDASNAIEGRAAPRAAARGAGHDARAASAASGRVAAQASDATDRNPATAAAPPLRAALERAASDGTAAPAARAPSFDARPVAETTAPTAASFAVALRDVSAPGAAGAHEVHAAHASLHAAIDDPAFGGALGRQVALWVRDGVQEARLQLHPAELGPVTVQIALDGQAAHVDFTAAVAATRDSIEQSLPALAAALRESGFTLAGGGVSSHAGQGNANHGEARARPAAGDRSRIDAGADGAAAGTAPRRWVRSLLDVYA